jgi:ATP-dependent Lon protease
VGTQRFKIDSLDHSHSYLRATVTQLPFVNASTRAADDLMHHIRPKVLEYVEVLAKASNSKIKLERVPQDPKTLAFLIAIALQVNNDDKQAILELPGIPDMLARESYLLSREVLLMRFMMDTQENINDMTGGPTGYVFPN